MALKTMPPYRVSRPPSTGLNLMCLFSLCVFFIVLKIKLMRFAVWKQTYGLETIMPTLSASDFHLTLQLRVFVCVCITFGHIPVTSWDSVQSKA